MFFPINQLIPCFLYICLTGKIQDINYNKSPLNPIRTVGRWNPPFPAVFCPYPKKQPIPEIS